MARRQGARPGSPGRRWHGLRPGPGRETSRPAPCGAPTGIFGLRLLNGRTDEERFVPGRILPERRPWVGLRERLPAGALPLPALRTPPEGAPRTRIGIGCL